MVISILPDEGPSLRVETLFSKTFAGVSDSRVNCLPSGMSVKLLLLLEEGEEGELAGLCFWF